MGARWLDRDLAGKTRELVTRADEYHQQFYAAGVFGGPSLHFHRRALGLHGAVTLEERVELIYAVLTSWGMHRMGASGSKMQPYEHFLSTVKDVQPYLQRLSQAQPSELDEKSWSELETVFKQIEVMASGTTIVGNSKVMAHLLPNLVAPIDREYTLTFLFGSTAFQNGLDREWLLMRKILAEFFYPVVGDRDFSGRAAEWNSETDAHPWDTSALKSVDNLVIGAKRRR